MWALMIVIISSVTNWKFHCNCNGTRINARRHTTVLTPEIASECFRNLAPTGVSPTVGVQDESYLWV